MTFLEKEPIEGVIHFAANSLVGESMTKPLKYYDNNLCGTKVLLESIRSASPMFSGVHPPPPR